MFIDGAKFIVRSGKGGAGCVSFRREKHVIQGGPDGGDGGDGGDIFFEVSNNSHTLAFYKGKRLLAAANGEPGAPKRMSGKKGESLTLIVPPGTAVFDDESGEQLLDLTRDNQRELFLKGGKGGLGNTHFKNSVNQAPTYAQGGLDGATLAVRLELKLIADVGLVGFPNVGKSTLISAVSNAKPQIANYEFTTLTPKLGQVAVGDFDGFVMADIPGIIEGAAQGRGLGLDFLRHIERTKLLLFVIDLASHREATAQFRALRTELASFSPALAARPFAIAFNKIDAAGEAAGAIVAEFLREFGLSETAGQGGAADGETRADEIVVDGVGETRADESVADKIAPSGEISVADTAAGGTGEIVAGGVAQTCAAVADGETRADKIAAGRAGADIFAFRQSGNGVFAFRQSSDGVFAFRQGGELGYDFTRPLFALAISAATNENLDALKFALLNALKI